MKKLFFYLLLLSIFVLSSCSKPRPTCDFVSPHYIVEYIHVCDNLLSSTFSAEYPHYPIILVYPQTDISYKYHDFDGQEVLGREREIYDSLAIKNNDTTYNSMIYCTQYHTTQSLLGLYVDYDRNCACSNNIVDINVICDKDWDANHPAGSSLNDLLTFRGITCWQFIKRHYTGEKRVKVNMPLTSMEPEDYRMTFYPNCKKPFDSGIELGFSAFPTAGDYPYVFTVTVTMDDGLQFTSTDELESPDPDR